MGVPLVLGAGGGDGCLSARALPALPAHFEMAKVVDWVLSVFHRNKNTHDFIHYKIFKNT